MVESGSLRKQRAHSILWLVVLILAVSCAGSRYGATVITSQQRNKPNEVLLHFVGPEGTYMLLDFALQCPDEEVYAPIAYKAHSTQWKALDTSVFMPLTGDFDIDLAFPDPSSPIEDCTLACKSGQYRISKD